MKIDLDRKCLSSLIKTNKYFSARFFFFFGWNCNFVSRFAALFFGKYIGYVMRINACCCYYKKKYTWIMEYKVDASLGRYQIYLLIVRCTYLSGPSFFFFLLVRWCIQQISLEWIQSKKLENKISWKDSRIFPVWDKKTSPEWWAQRRQPN